MAELYSFSINNTILPSDIPLQFRHNRLERKKVYHDN